MLAAEKRCETHILRNEEKEIWIADEIERETAVARQRVEDAVAVIREEQEDTQPADTTGLTTMEPQKMYHEMMVAIGDILTDIASSDYGKDLEDDNNDESEQGQLTENDEPGCVMHTITLMVQERMDKFRQKRINFNKPTEPKWKNVADNYRERL